jgi:hypothetical protein
MPLTYKLRNKQYRLFFLGKPELLLGFFCAYFFTCHATLSFFGYLQSEHCFPITIKTV